MRLPRNIIIFCLKEMFYEYTLLCFKKSFTNIDPKFWIQKLIIWILDKTAEKKSRSQTCLNLLYNLMLWYEENFVHEIVFD